MKHSLTVLFLLAGATCLPAAEKLTGGNATLFLGGFPNRIMILDEATERVVGDIRTRTGIPRNMSLSLDKKRFYLMSALMEDIEVVDIASRKVIDTFRLSEGNKKVRIRSFTADPTHQYLVLLTKTATKHVDRWEIGANVLQVYDMKERKVTRTIPWPKGEEREFAQLAFSPDGKYLYFFGDDVLIYDTKEWKEVDKWEISRPLEDGYGRINFGPSDSNYDPPGVFTGLFSMQDPVANRRIMGIARVNLSEKKLDFRPIGPQAGVGFALAPDRKRAFGLSQEIGRYEFWSFDVEHARLLGRQEFRGRPRMSLKVSSNGKLLYVYNAGNTIDLYDASNYKYLRTIALDADMTTDLHIMPR
jgi:WD40 repeat protein